MSDVVIRARDLTKVYRLYTGPGYRFLDMFGLLGERPDAFTEHAALDGVSLEIARGEKVAFIGRNGAGKSTLLKLVTRVIEPTSGVLEVAGKVHALLQIGTGFHPDFTGRDNIFAYLAQLGVTGREAAEKYLEIVEFAELEEYVGQPVKTYSSGMAARLMFATATAITPELLVLDEVLGVGDAYFAHKSYERMKELCDGEGTTLLLVTHDIYSAARICERIVWIDRGRVLMDGDGAVVIKAYEDSVRQQEEARLRLKKQARLRHFAAHGPGARRDLLVEIKPARGRPLSTPVYFSRVALRTAGGEHASLPLGADGFDEHQPAHLQREGASWGDPVIWQGRPSRALLNYGGAFHKVAGVLPMPADLVGAAVEIDYWAEGETDLAVEVFWDRTSALLSRFGEGVGEWRTAVLPLAEAAARAEGAAMGVNTTGVHGSGALVVHGARTLDGDGRETYVLRHGEPATVEIDYEVMDPSMCERPHVVIALHRDGVQDVCRWIARDLVVDAVAMRRGAIRLRVPRLLLADGQYSVTILIAKEGYYDQQQTKFYTLNTDVYYCASRMFDFRVEGTGLIGAGTVTVAEGEWGTTS